MSQIAVADIDHPDLALMPTIKSVDDVEIRVVPHSSTDPETSLFFFLVRDPSDGFGSFEAALEADHTVDEASLVTGSDAKRIYRLKNTDEAKLLSPRVSELGGFMLEAESKHSKWSVRLQLPDRASVSTLWEYCEAESIRFELVRLYRTDGPTVGARTNLTEAQRDALEVAYEEGYFEEPRETSLEDLAEELDISPTAVGGRIRRGTSKLVETTLLDE